MRRLSSQALPSPTPPMFDYIVDGSKNDTNDSSNGGGRRFVVTLRPTTTEAVEDGAPDYFAPLRGFMMMANLEGEWQGEPVGQWDVGDNGNDASKLAKVIH